VNPFAYSPDAGAGAVAAGVAAGFALDESRLHAAPETPIATLNTHAINSRMSDILLLESGHPVI
jgi:hypothetical protein